MQITKEYNKSIFYLENYKKADINYIYNNYPNIIYDKNLVKFTKNKIVQRGKNHYWKSFIYLHETPFEYMMYLFDSINDCCNYVIIKKFSYNNSDFPRLIDVTGSVCTVCNLKIPLMLSIKSIGNFTLNEPYNKVSYGLFYYDLYNKIITTCDEIIIKNILE